MVYVLVAYDVRDDDARNRLARDLLAAGFSRLQKSVYLHRGAYRGLVERVARLALRRIDPETDSVLIMTVPDGVVEKAIVIGAGSGVNREDARIL